MCVFLQLVYCRVWSYLGKRPRCRLYNMDFYNGNFSLKYVNKAGKDSWPNESSNISGFYNLKTTLIQLHMLRTYTLFYK